jgi:hypothetical protein
MAKYNALLRREQEFWKPASGLRRVTEQEHPSLEVPALKSLIKSVNRGSIVEICGGRSSSKTAASLYVLARATQQGEVCAVIDTKDSFCPFTAHAAGVRLERLIWIRCRSNPEYSLRITDLLLHAGGFGVVLLDLCEVEARMLNRIPLSYWYRFRRALENTPSILLICADTFQAKSCSSSRLELKGKQALWIGAAPFHVLSEIQVEAAASKTATFRRHSLQIYSWQTSGVA